MSLQRRDFIVIGYGEMQYRLSWANDRPDINACTMPPERAMPAGRPGRHHSRLQQPANRDAAIGNDYQAKSYLLHIDGLRNFIDGINLSTSVPDEPKTDRRKVKRSIKAR